MLTLYIVFAWLLGICYGFVLISSAALQSEANLFQVGQTAVYQWHSTVLLNEKNGNSKNVGFFITGDVLVSNVWGESSDKILKLELRAPQLHIRSRKAPSPDGFIQHSSKLEQYSLKPFYLIWRSGKIDGIFLPQDEVLSFANIKKGISSLFQFQLFDGDSNETDSSGFCRVKYYSVDSTAFEKLKTNCVSSDLPFVKNSDFILETLVKSTRKINWELDSSFAFFKTIYSREKHEMFLSAREDLGNSVEAEQVLTHIKNVENREKLSGNSIEDALETVSIGYKKESLQIEKEDLTNQEETKTFTNSINDLRDALKEKHLGTLVSTKAFLKLIEIARKASKDDIHKALNSKKNQKILPQIYDVLGYVQNEEIHLTVLKKLHFDQEEHLDSSERYLWALSMSSHQNPEIISDLLKRYLKNDNYPEKLKETLLLTIASMAKKLPKATLEERKVQRNVQEAILNGLDYAKNEDRYVFLRALKNLKSPATIPVLVKTIKNGIPKEGVLAYKALTSFDPEFWDSNIQSVARKTFLQLDKKYDSSARTLAVDILLETKPSDSLLKDFLYYLKYNDTSFEVKQYVFQKLRMVGEEDEKFDKRISEIIKNDPSLNNYSVLSPRGLSTALKRNFLKSQSMNGSLLSIQEIFGGIVKRGIVNVMLEKGNKKREMFSLGIFAGGLSSFMGGDTEGDEETATAGMELTILNNQIRPFVFFSGQGELMGHVWSGTASDKTTAFQASILLQDHLEYLRLGTGFIAELNLKGAMSFDLSAKIEISIWGRTADALVEKVVGILVNGVIAIDADFVRSKTEFSASVEPKLNIKSDIDFSGGVNLCMKVTQPDTVFRHNIFKIERIPGSKHKLRIAKYKKALVPGTTYALNRKNSEMCSVMFS